MGHNAPIWYVSVHLRFHFQLLVLFDILTISHCSLGSPRSYFQVVELFGEDLQDHQVVRKNMD